jgi:hypothetical protein
MADLISFFMFNQTFIVVFVLLLIGNRNKNDIDQVNSQYMFFTVSLFFMIAFVPFILGRTLKKN